MAKVDKLKRMYCNKTEIPKEEYMAAKAAMEPEAFKNQYSWAADQKGGNLYYKYEAYVAEEALLLFLDDIRREVDETKQFARNTWYFVIAVIVLNVISFLLTLLAIG